MKPKLSRSSKGFTLIELLVATAVLLLVMVLALNIIGSASSISSATSKRVVVREEVRNIFDRMGLDIGSLAKFGYYQFKVGADSMSIVSMSDTSGADSRLQRADYSIVKSKDENSRLVRAIGPIDWDSRQDISAGSGPDEVLSKSATVMQVAALMSDGSSVRLLNSPSLYTNPQPKAIVVALAMIDPVIRTKRDIDPPTFSFANNEFKIAATDEQAGWKLFQRTFRIP